MKYIKIENNKVVEIGVINQEDWISFLEAMGSNNYFPLEDSTQVWRGCTWDAENSTCLPDPQPPPSFESITTEMVRTKIDNLREAYINKYVGIWGRVSSQMLWPVLDKELEHINTDVLSILDTPDKKSIPWPQYPSLRGYIGARLGKPAASVTDAEVRATATSLQQKKAEHTKILTCTEMARNQLIAEFTLLSNLEEKSNFYQELDAKWGELNAQT